MTRAQRTVLWVCAPVFVLACVLLGMHDTGALFATIAVFLVLGTVVSVVLALVDTAGWASRRDRRR